MLYWVYTFCLPSFVLFPPHYVLLCSSMVLFFLFEWWSILKTFVFVCSLRSVGTSYDTVLLLSLLQINNLSFFVGFLYILYYCSNYITLLCFTTLKLTRFFLLYLSLYLWLNFRSCVDYYKSLLKILCFIFASCHFGVGSLFCRLKKLCLLECRDSLH